MPKHTVVSLMRGVFKCRVYVLSFEERIVDQNLIEAGAISQKLKNIADSNTVAAYAGTAPALAFFHRDSPEPIGIHLQLSPRL